MGALSYYSVYRYAKVSATLTTSLRSAFFEFLGLHDRTDPKHLGVHA